MLLTQKLETLNALRPLSADAVASISAAWDTKMIYESNSIEGNSLTLRETDIVLARGLTVSGKPLRDHIEAINLALAWEQVKSLAKNAKHFCESDLLAIHRNVMTRVEDQYAGSYRTASVRISGSSLIPPNPVKVHDLMQQLFSSVATLTDPIEKSAALHHGITRIHPFSDGNGRTARLAMNFILLTAGYPPISIAPDDRLSYYQALEAADASHLPAFQALLEKQLLRELDTWLTALQPHCALLTPR
jgi:Fic family protein